MTEEMREFIRQVIREELELRMKFTFPDSWSSAKVEVTVLMAGEEVASDYVYLPGLS